MFGLFNKTKTPQLAQPSEITSLTLKADFEALGIEPVEAACIISKLNLIKHEMTQEGVSSVDIGGQYTLTLHNGNIELTKKLTEKEF